MEKNVEFEQVVEKGCGLDVHKDNVNPRHTKNVPGRKTDMNDSQWLAKLLIAGLLKCSFIPNSSRRTLRVPSCLKSKRLQCHSHNHPSENLVPSEADKSITQKIKEAGKFLDIPLLDHLIMVRGDGYMSFADEGLI